VTATYKGRFKKGKKREEKGGGNHPSETGRGGKLPGRGKEVKRKGTTTIRCGVDKQYASGEVDG